MGGCAPKRKKPQEPPFRRLRSETRLRAQRGNLLLCGAVFVQADSHRASRMYNVNWCPAKNDFKAGDCHSPAGFAMTEFFYAKQSREVVVAGGLADDHRAPAAQPPKPSPRGKPYGSCVAKAPSKRKRRAQGPPFSDYFCVSFLQAAARSFRVEQEIMVQTCDMVAALRI